MEIKYLGHSSFLIKTKTGKIITDPFDPTMVGIKFPKVEADIITVSHQHQDHNNVKAVLSLENQKQPLVIDMPGEFESQGIRIFGYLSYHDEKKGEERGENILYKIEAEDTTILHCGDLGLLPDDDFLDVIGDIDILLVPVGGFYTIDSEKAFQLTKKIEPSIVIPMHYNHEKLNQEVFGKLAKVDEIVKKFGLEKPQLLPKLVYKKEELGEKMELVVLEI